MHINVAIIGASSTGLYAAEKLARGGKRVGVFEQGSSPLIARRTLIVTPHLQQALHGIPSSIVAHRAHTLQIETARERLQIHLQDPDLVVDRRELLTLLTQRARAAGAEIHHGYRFSSIEPTSNGAKIHFRRARTNDCSVTADIVVGADGALSDIALAAGLSQAPTVPILQAEVNLPPDWNPSITQVWIDTEDTRFFYWLIPESDQRAVVGLVGDNRAHIRTLLTRFLARHGFAPLAYQGARIALYHPRLQISTWLRKTPVYLIGDAAGHVKVTTVGGTVSGLLGASAVVRSILDGRTYHEELRTLKRELDLHWWIRALLDRLDNADYDRLARLVTPRVQHFLSVHNRDEMFGPIWQLPFLQPELMAIGLKGLLSGPFGRRDAKPGAVPSAE